jgi:hypothetical protein
MGNTALAYKKDLLGENPIGMQEIKSSCQKL